MSARAKSQRLTLRRRRICADDPPERSERRQGGATVSSPTERPVPETRRRSRRRGDPEVDGQRRPERLAVRRRAARHVRRRRVRRHVRLRRAGARAVGAAGSSAAVRQLLRRDHGEPRRGVLVDRARRDEGGRRSRRADAAHRARAPHPDRDDPAQRPVAALRAVLERVRCRLPGLAEPAALGLPAGLDDLPAAHPPRGRGQRRGSAHPVGHRAVPRRRLAGARGLRPVRDRLRRPPGADPHPDARRLGRPPAAQGLPVGRHPGAVQGRHHSTS